MNNRLIESDEGWNLALSDARVGCIHVDFRVGLEISDATGAARLVIETPCQLRRTTRELSIVPDEVATITPMLMLFNVGVDGIAIHRNGELTVQFANGDRLDVRPSDQYEAWQIACENEFLIVCQPGGAVSIFQESASEL